MVDIFQLCPGPGSPVPWDEIDARFAWIRNLKGCPQNPSYHAEGDVWIHTRMVCEAMVGLDSWGRLDETLRQDLFASALLHDAAKPECTKVQAGGRVTSRGHARRGALLARRLLWSDGVSASRRERICALVRHHMVPLYLRDSDHQERQVLTISQSLRCDLLGILGRADADGRICDDPQDLDDRHRAYEQICSELGCFERAFDFPSAATRFRYFHQLTDDPRALVDGEGPRVVLMSGLPGAGKRRWVERNLSDEPLLDIDALRAKHGITWRENQGAVISEARGQAREMLSRGQSFVWLDMNLGRQLRDHLIRLFAELGAAVQLTYLEASPESVRSALEADKAREGDLELLLDHWEAPEAQEAHRLEVVDLEPAEKRDQGVGQDQGVEKDQGIDRDQGIEKDQGPAAGGLQTLSPVTEPVSAIS